MKKYSKIGLFKSKGRIYRESISKGDKVVTIGGLHGKVLSVSDQTVVLEFESGKARVSKTALSHTGTPDSEEVK